MTALLRNASPALAAALRSGQRLWSAELMTFTLADSSILRLTNFDRDLTSSGQAFSAGGPFLGRSSWKVTNTMTVPSLSIELSAGMAAFRGGPAIEAQIVAGLFDGAAFLLEDAFMLSAGAVDTLGTVPTFGGYVGPIDGAGATYKLEIKGRTNDLDQFVPRNLYQIPCLHAFCNAGCTLARASFTASYTVGSGPTDSFIPWASAPSIPVRYQSGTLAMTGGAAAGARRTIIKADSSGLTLAYPLPAIPLSGDAFTAFEGCDKTLASGSGQSCTDRSNTAHYRGFPFVPPPTASY